MFSAEENMAGTGKEFLEKTRYRYLASSDQAKGKRIPPFEIPAGEEEQRIPLPEISGIEIPAIDLTDAINRRRSIRKYADIPLSMEELAYLLWITQGVKEVIPGSATLRTVPSAGARHALETYLLINNVKGLGPGLYRYLALEHLLVPVNMARDIALHITESCLGQTMVMKSGCTFIWVADIYRMTWRYGERGYRYIFLDAGHVCQNLYLGSEVVGCGACAIAAFSDEYLNKVLELDGEKRFALYIATVGKK
jgi:SagB-type dehydrogenase family enzyme